MSRICRIVVVCEDWRHSAFARGFVSQAGVDGRSLDLRVNPGGSGHDWVKGTFVDEVANLARFSEGRGVLALLDEDGVGTAKCQREVADGLLARGLPGIAADDGRCLVLPTRNVETWLYWLTAQRKGEAIVVDEITDYKKNGPPAGTTRIENSDCRPSGEFLHGLDHSSLPAGCPSMLKVALPQLRGFLNAARR